MPTWSTRGGLVTALTFVLAACSGGGLSELDHGSSTVVGTIGTDISKSGTIEEFGVRGGSRFRALAAVGGGLYDFAGSHVVAVTADGTVVGSSPIDAQGGFSVQAPKGQTAALMLASKGPSGGWVCQQDLVYGGATPDTFVKAVLKFDGSFRAGDFAFNPTTGQPASSRGEAAAHVVSSAAFLDGSLGGYARCGNAKVVESLAKVDFTFKQQGFDPSIKPDDARFYRDAVVLGLDTSKPGTPRLVGSSAPDDTGVATIRVRHEQGEAVKLSPTIVDTRAPGDPQAPVTPAWNGGLPATDVTGGEDFGTLAGTFIKLSGKVRDAGGQGAATAAVSAAIHQDATAPDREIARTLAVSDAAGQYAMLLPVPDADRQWNLAARSADRKASGSGSFATTAAMRSATGLAAPDLTVQTPTGTRLEGFGTNAVDYVSATANDASGTVVMVGQTDGTLPGESNEGARDFFVRKYDAAGNVVFTKQFGSDEADAAYDVALDAAGNFYVVGEAQDDLCGAIHNGSSSTPNSFVMKLDANGQRLWTKLLNAQGNGDHGARAVALNGSGDLFVGGFAQGRLEGSTASGSGDDAYLVKFDAGSLGGSTAPASAWTIQYALPAEEQVVDLLFDANDNLYLTGATTGIVSGSNVGGQDVFLVRLLDAQLDAATPSSSLNAANFKAQWGTPGNDSGATLAFDASGGLYVAGTAGNGALGGNPATAGFAAFATHFQLGSAPTLDWTRTWVLAQNGLAQAIDVTADASGNAYVVGKAAGSVADLNAMKTSMFVRKLQPDGGTVWTRSLASQNGAAGFAATWNAQKALVVGGWADSQIGSVTNNGSWDALVVTMDQNGN